MGCGRPIWIDDTDFDIGSHVSIIDCPVPGDEAALLNVAAGVICTRLPSDRPLWRMALVTGLAGERTALIVAFHHVLADGIGGLAVLVNLVDGVPADPVDGFPRPAPTNLQLLRDAVRSRWATLATLPASVRRARATIVQLRPAANAHPGRSSLNRPTGALRQFGVARADLEEVRRVAHASPATVNDVVLTAVAGALHTLLRARGEAVDRFTVSVPVSARQQASATQLGNQVGVIPIELPAIGDPLCGSARSPTDRAAKQAPPAASTALLGPIFRLLRASASSNGSSTASDSCTRSSRTCVGPMPGSTSSARRSSMSLRCVVTGNVSVSSPRSPAGMLDVTVIADPDVCPISSRSGMPSNTNSTG